MAASNLHKILLKYVRKLELHLYHYDLYLNDYIVNSGPVLADLSWPPFWLPGGVITPSGIGRNVRWLYSHGVANIEALWLLSKVHVTFLKTYTKIEDVV